MPHALRPQHAKVVHLGDQVYPEGGPVGKPELGEGLNKPAEVTLNNLYKLDEDGNRSKDAEQQKRFERRLQVNAAKQNAQYVSYDSERGIWKFRVEHFSKYAPFSSSHIPHIPDSAEKKLLMVLTRGVCNAAHPPVLLVQMW